MTLDNTQRIARLSAGQRALLEERLKGRKSGETSQLKVSPRAQRNTAPLSFAQQRLWFLEHWDPGTAVYNVCIPLRIRGALDVEALERSLNKVIERHEVLRTYLLSTFSGESNQVILPQLTVRLPVIPLPIAESDRSAFLQRLASEESQRPLSLGEAPLFRAKLYRSSSDDHLLFFVIHHIVYDGWSLGILVKEWFYYYEAYAHGREAQLPALPFQYGDFAAWQREHIDDDAHRKQAAYWQRQLAERDDVVELLADHPRPPHLTFKGRLHRLAIPRELKQALLKLGRAEGATYHVTTLAALGVLLHRHTGQSDLIVGTPVADRPYAETEPLIGYFVNTLPIRVKVTGELSFRDLLRQVQQTMLNALDNRSLPFERVIEELQLERDTSRSPLFQVFFATQKSLLPPFQTESLTLETSQLDNATAMFELSLFLYEEGDCDILQYNTDLFDESTIDLLARRFVMTLQQAVDDPTRRVVDFCVLADGERERLLRWSQGPTLDVPTAGIHGRFEEQVARTPDAAAVVCGEETWTYAELEATANRVARLLRKRGVGRGARVGLCLERSPWLLACLLGVLKAGAAYVPLDHEYPRARLATMIEDARLSLVVTEDHLLKNLPHSGLEVVLLDRNKDAISRESSSRIDDRVAPDDLAYVIYTSGSTGRPKGVEIVHDSVVNFLESMRIEPGLSENDRLAAITSISFDIAGLELYLPLVCGATVVMATREQARDSYQLAALMERSATTVMQATPATWRMLLDARWKNPRRLKMLVGGEALPRDLAQGLLATGGELWNLYGPTEVTIWATIARILPNSESISIGRPIANTQAYVLDASLHPVAIGGVGELYLGGRGLARGYFDAPDLTAKRFVRNPFGNAPTDRIYATGDRVRFRRDGALEYLGRVDQQVKLHGFRIELGEIETALREHPSVREAAAVLREDSHGHRGLVGYVVRDPSYRGDDPEPSTQEDHVKGWLSLYDQVYQDVAPGQDGSLDIIGWNSSYTGQLIAAEEMIEQIEQTTNRVLALGPKRVLELGCGTGLHLSRIAPHTDYYLATDGSATALRSLRKQTDLSALPQVELRQLPAHALEALGSQRFDCVLINSVIQYFPDVSYLVGVLRQAVQLVAPGGTIVVADVRNYRLLDAYHASVQLAKAADDARPEDLRREIKNQIQKENELLVAPAFFSAIRDQLPAIGAVEIQLRRGRAHNELTRFRYDVFLHIGSRSDDPPAPAWHWSDEHLTLETLEARLLECAPEIVCIEGVPNARIAEEVRTLAILSQDPLPRSVGQLRTMLQTDGSAIDPEDLWGLGGRMGYAVEISWSLPHEGADGTYRVVLRRGAPGRACAGNSTVAAPAEAKPRAFWNAFVNDLEQRRFVERIPEIRRFVQERLPSYMVPGTIVSIDALPLTPNGKLDRHALATSQSMGAVQTGTYVEPRTDQEKQLARIWADVLRVERIGRDDDYFALGGDSVRSILLISRSTEAGFAFTSKQLFEHRTIAALLESVHAPEDPPPQTEARRLPELRDVAPLIPNLDEVEAVYPTTSYQRWAIRRHEVLRDPGLFLIQPHWRIRNERFDSEAFVEAWQRTVMSHEALRSAFAWEGLPEPVLVVFKRAQAEVNQLDLRQMSYEEQRERMNEFLAGDFRRGFISKGPSHIRLGLIRLDDDDYVFVYTLNHILQDGWSMSMFLHDALAQYASLRDGRPAPQLQQRRPYRDALAWGFQQDRGRAHAFWKKMLAGFSKPNRLVSYDVALDPENEVACREIVLSAALSSGLHELCKRHHLTLWNFIAGVWALVVSAETRDDDVVFGLVASGRPAHMEGIEYTVGSMINLLPLRLRISGGQEFISWMKELQPLLWEVKNYEYADALTIWDESEMRTEELPFQSHITFMSQPLDKYALTVGRDWAHGVMKTARTGVPLKLEVVPLVPIVLRLQYYKACFDDAAIPRIAAGLTFFLQAILENPHCIVDEMKTRLREKIATERGEP